MGQDQQHPGGPNEAVNTIPFPPKKKVIYEALNLDIIYRLKRILLKSFAAGGTQTKNYKGVVDTRPGNF